MYIRIRAGMNIDDLLMRDKRFADALGNAQCYDFDEFSKPPTKPCSRLEGGILPPSIGISLPACGKCSCR